MGFDSFIINQKTHEMWDRGGYHFVNTGEKLVGGKKYICRTYTREMGMPERVARVSSFALSCLPCLICWCVSDSHFIDMFTRYPLEGKAERLAYILDEVASAQLRKEDNEQLGFTLEDAASMKRFMFSEAQKEKVHTCQGYQFLPFITPVSKSSCFLFYESDNVPVQLIFCHDREGNSFEMPVLMQQAESFCDQKMQSKCSEEDPKYRRSTMTSTASGSLFGGGLSDPLLL